MLEDLPANLRLQLDIVMNRSLFLKVPSPHSPSRPILRVTLPCLTLTHVMLPNRFFTARPLTSYSCGRRAPGPRLP